MTTLTDRKYLEDLWTDDIPEENGEYMVTFLAKWFSWNGEPKEFRGIDIVECDVTNDGDHWNVTWYTKEIEKRFRDATIEVIAWMPLPEVAE